MTPTEIDFFDFSYRQSFKIKNRGELPLEWSCFENPDETWITDVTPTSGMLYQGQSQYVEVQVGRSGLGDGNYEGNISITSNGGDDNVKVLMEVVSKVPILQVQPLDLNYGAILTKRVFNIKNVGTADLDWNTKNKNNDSWIKMISPTIGKIEPGKSQEVQVTADRVGLTDSTYQGVIVVGSNGGSENVALTLENYNAPLTINCGGGVYKDNDEKDWSYDLGFVGGQNFYSNAAIQNTDNDQLYQYARLGMMKYQFAVQKNGYYKVTLHFAELQNDASGKRLFDMKIEDSLVVQDFDICAEHGKNYAMVRSANIEVTDQQIDISFIKKNGEPCIAGIEIHQIPFLQVESTALNFASILTKRNFTVKNIGTLDLNWAANNQNNDPWLVAISPTNGLLVPFDSQQVGVTIDRANLADSLYQGLIAVETDGGNRNVSLTFETKNKPLRINCGGGEYLDQSKNYWLHDMLFLDGKLINCRDSITNTIDDQLYQTSRSGMMKYEFPVQQNGLYKVTLHFAEFQHQAAGKRIFDVQIEDSLVLNDFDIYAESGYLVAVINEAKVKINDNQLDIVFISKTGEPCIAGIEVAQIPELPTGLVWADNSRSIPDCFQLEQNYPNPFNLETRIAFQIPIAARVTLEVYNLLGQKQQTLVNQEMTAGFHSINWDGRDLNGAPVTSGLYIYKIQVIPKDGQMTSFQQVRKMLLLK